MVENKLIVVIMGQDCERFIGMCLESVKDADVIVYCDGGSTDNTVELVGKINPHVEYIRNKYNQEDKTMNGKQRNFYLDYIKKNYPNDWALCIDADEVVEDIDNIKEFIQSAGDGLYSVHMRHFHNDLGHEDATQERHYVLNRLFKISEADTYPEVEHPVLYGKVEGKTDCTTIWHLAHINHVFNIKGRYEKNIKHSNIHTSEFLDNWKDAHMLGQYPNKPVSVLDVPDVILNYFHINKDKYYFANRGIELKHPMMVKQWNDYFKPESVLDLGCGRGPYLYFWRWFVEKSWGIEISNWAVNNQFIHGILEGSIVDESKYNNTDLITSVDILEHLNDEDLDKTLKNISKHGKQFLFSIPFIGDPNLEKDKTHVQKKTKEEWIKLIESYGIKIKPTPEDWMFKEQILVGKKNES